MIQDNFTIPFPYGYIIIVAAAIGGLWMSTSASKPQKVVAVQAPDISIYDAANDGNIEAVKQHLADGADVNAKNDRAQTPIDWAEVEIADLLRKHGGKTGKELKAESK